MKKVFLLLAGFMLVFASCSDNDDDVIAVSGDLEVQDFIWKSMNYWYLWQEDVEDLADDRFRNNDEYESFLSRFSSPQSLFFNLCNQHINVVGESAAIDRFSFITDDYVELLNSQQGVFKSNGVEFGLGRITGTTNVFGYVRYIIPGSDAATKNIQRGDAFTGVDGQTLTLDNYVNLLFGSNDTYTLNMADISGGVITPNSREVSLTKQELTENPVLISTHFDVNGTKIGYVMYNAFTSNFDDELNDAFGQLKSARVTELVLDLRYNPGGSVNSSAALASMITGQFNGDLFLKGVWNSNVQNRVARNTEFPSQVNGSAINSLNLTKVYILALNSSASASELVINGLEPHINVIHIGDVTTGKNEFSITLFDAPNADLRYRPRNFNEINPNHTYAVQPLVGRNENSIGDSDYTSGLVPDIELKEDLSNLGVLGSQNEPLLARAIQEITGTISRSLISTPVIPIKEITNSKMFKPTKDNMYIELN
ncbi:S41 family peptidase [Ascidiimonas aurantiaca]|uniref:S41 family peptidase n=1 Tax=Ascidiimonas aurantiaca TaxID=1685432 RepID=UPI0030ED37B7